MDSKIREAQNQILKVFSKEAKDIALAGGTALELYFLYSGIFSATVVV